MAKWLKNTRNSKKFRKNVKIGIIRIITYFIYIGLYGGFLSHLATFKSKSAASEFYVENL